MRKKPTNVAMVRRCVFFYNICRTSNTYNWLYSHNLSSQLSKIWLILSVVMISNYTEYINLTWQYNYILFSIIFFKNKNKEHRYLFQIKQRSFFTRIDPPFFCIFNPSLPQDSSRGWSVKKMKNSRISYKNSNLNQVCYVKFFFAISTDETTRRHPTNVLQQGFALMTCINTSVKWNICSFSPYRHDGNSSHLVPS